MTRIGSIINELMFWIDKNLESNLSVEVIAKKSGYHREHLQKIFKKETGITLGCYVRTQRLARAAEELWVTDYAIRIISDRYQFDSQQTFSRVFKKHFCITPSAYRKIRRSLSSTNTLNNYSQCN
ncbi:helix-turn-helix domain-containing protein [Providencia rettgeri]